MKKLINALRKLLLQYQINLAMKKRDVLNAFSRKKYAVFVIGNRKVILINKTDFMKLQRKHIIKESVTWGDFKRKYEIR